jgi:hypothetical protein
MVGRMGGLAGMGEMVEEVAMGLMEAVADG